MEEIGFTKKDGYWVATLLFVILILVITDLFADIHQGTSFYHITIEILLGILTLFAFIFILKILYENKIALAQSKVIQEQKEIDANRWKKESQKILKGLGQAIDDQLIRWKLSPAEKEIALLLLKGLSLKEIAIIRETTDQTARVQSASVYFKSGLSGRTELAAFFLEDLLLPQEES